MSDNNEVLTKCGLTRQQLLDSGYTHLARHKHDSPIGRFKKGQGYFVKYNEATGEYSRGMICLLDPDENYCIEPI